MGHLGWAGDLVTRLGQPAETVWLGALFVAFVGPLLAVVVPRLARVAALILASASFAAALVATMQQQTMVALGLITFALATGFVGSWSTSTVRDAVGPLAPGPTPRHRIGNLALTPAQSRSFDYLVARSR